MLTNIYNSRIILIKIITYYSQNYACWHIRLTLRVNCLACNLLTSILANTATLNLFLFPEILQIFWNYSLCFEVPIIPEIIPV